MLAGCKVPGLAVVLTAGIAAPLYAALTGAPVVWPSSLEGWLRYLAGLAFAALLVVLLWPLARLLEQVPLHRALPLPRGHASAMGATRVRWDAEGIDHIFASGGARQLKWTQVSAVLRSARMISILAKRQRFAVVLPARAFADAAQIQETLRAFEAASGQTAIEIEPNVPPKHAASTQDYVEQVRRPALTVALLLALTLFGVFRLVPWLDDPRRGNPPQRVVVYSTVWCPACRRLRECLTRSEVPFEERDVEHSERGRREWRALDGVGVPVVMVGAEAVEGPSQPQLSSLLAVAGYRVDCTRGLAAPLLEPLIR